MRFVAGLKKVFVKNKKKFLLYAIITFILFALTALLSNKKVLSNLPLSNYISFQVVFLILGTINVIASRKIFPDINEKRTSFLNEFLFNIVIAMIGLTTFIYITGLNKPDYVYFFITAISAFFIPFMTTKLYEYTLAIPAAVYKTWKYPLEKNIKEPNSNELSNPLVVSFEFNKENNSDEISNFRLKAPEKMELGKLFYFFMKEYNERNPEGNIKHIDKNSEQPYEWIFYKKGSFFKPERYLNHAHTIEANDIKENDIIICQRA